MLPSATIMRQVLEKTLSLLIPKWVLRDAANRLTHPYWRRRGVPLQSLRRAETIGPGDRREKTVSRRPFKRVDRRRVLAALRAAGARTILDVGCGDGGLVRHLESLGFEAHGVTINPEESQLAGHDRVYLVDIQADLAGTPLAGRLFDAVLSFDCLEHLDTPLAALRNINALLPTDGVFIAHIPPVRWTECDYHTIVYTPRQFRWLLNVTGFELEHKQGRHRFTNRGTTYYARKRYADRMVYPGVLE